MSELSLAESASTVKPNHSYLDRAGLEDLRRWIISDLDSAKKSVELGCVQQAEYDLERVQRGIQAYWRRQWVETEAHHG